MSKLVISYATTHVFTILIPPFHNMFSAKFHCLQFLQLFLSCASFESVCYIQVLCENTLGLSLTFVIQNRRQHEGNLEFKKKLLIKSSVFNGRPYGDCNVFLLRSSVSVLFFFSFFLSAQFLRDGWINFPQIFSDKR